MCFWWISIVISIGHGQTIYIGPLDLAYRIKTLELNRPEFKYILPSHVHVTCTSLVYMNKIYRPGWPTPDWSCILHGILAGAASRQSSYDMQNSFSLATDRGFLGFLLINNHTAWNTLEFDQDISDVASAIWKTPVANLQKYFHWSAWSMNLN
jgi:hypothetical protein